MSRVILFLVVIGVTIYAAIDCFGSEDAEIRGLPRRLWLLLIVFTLPFGGVLWLFFGRQGVPRGPRGPRSGRLRTIGPDDDPDFLRTLSPPRPRGDRRPKDSDDDDNPAPS